jgi:malate dehydrogenase
VTHLDVMRARAFLAEAMSVPPEGVDVPVIGGHAGDTILPLLSQVTPAFAFTDAEVQALTVRIQNAGTEARLAPRVLRPACRSSRRLPRR